MKKWSFLLCFALLTANITIGQITKRTLFIGNSYIGANNLPDFTAALAASAGDQLIFDSNSPGGQTLQQHASNSTSLSKISQGNWDYVVLQEQSQMPAFPLSQVQQQVFPYARYLDSIINLKNPCAETIFYMTWGRKNGDAQNCQYYQPLCTYQGMDSLLRLRYTMMAQNNNAILSPVSVVWRYLRQNNPQIELYTSDESHPSVEGSYAAACTFYTTIFRKSPLAITSDYGLDPAVAAAIRQAVKTEVFDQMPTWLIGTYDPISQFTYTSAGSTFNFLNTSQNADTYTWSFGDGNMSNLADPSHTFANDGVYNVRLIAERCGVKDTSITAVYVGLVGIDGVAGQESISAFPNPTSDLLTVNIASSENLVLVNLLGQKMEVHMTELNGQVVIDCRSLASGVYQLRVGTRGHISIYKQ